MHSASMLSHGFILSLSLCLDIGLVNVAILSLSLSQGFRPGFLLGLGSCFGDLAYAALALAGMAALLRFDAVRWVVWVGAAAMLPYLTWKMARMGFFPKALPAAAGATEDQAPKDAVASTRSSGEFLRGLMLAISSPSAIVWFAAVGGALIAKAGATNARAASVFLVGFFLGGLCWTLFLCTLASQGRRHAGAGLLRTCHIASALLFAYLSYNVIVDGYRDLVAHAVQAA
jgi:L-lysine exporter family protein LysE/ArgO